MELVGLLVKQKSRKNAVLFLAGCCLHVTSLLSHELNETCVGRTDTDAPGWTHSL